MCWGKNGPFSMKQKSVKVDKRCKQVIITAETKNFARGHPKGILKKTTKGKPIKISKYDSKHV